MHYNQGDKIEVMIAREGLGEDEGIGYLPDETMVIVVGAGGKVGESVQATIVNVARTPLGQSFVANAAF